MSNRCMRSHRVNSVLTALSFPKTNQVPDLIKFPELVLLDMFYHVPCLLYALPFLVFGGAHAWFWGCWMATW